MFFEEKSDKFVSLEEILNDYLEAIPKVISNFETLLNTTQ